MFFFYFTLITAVGTEPLSKKNIFLHKLVVQAQRHFRLLTAVMKINSSIQ